MRIVLDSGMKKELSEREMLKLDAKLREIPELVSWSYSASTGELILDFGDAEDEKMLRRINDWKDKAKAVKVLLFEFLGIIKEWESA